MLFNSLEYAIFLVVAFLVYWALHRSPRVGVLLAAAVGGSVFAFLSFEPQLWPAVAGLVDAVTGQATAMAAGQPHYGWTAPAPAESFATLVPPLILAAILARKAGASGGVLRLAFLTMASYIFYAASNPWFLLLIIASTVTDYTAGMGMADLDDETDDLGSNKRLTLAGALGAVVALSLVAATSTSWNVAILVGAGLATLVFVALTLTKGARRQWLVLSLMVNLGLLGVFKYADFFWESVVFSVNGISEAFTGEPTDLVYEKLGILLPAGISFYTFQTMSYSIDLYRRRCEPERNLLRFAFFVGYFPQLVAGPIVRAVDFLPQIGNKPLLTRQQASRALFLIMIGLFKKALADYLSGNMVDRVFEEPLKYGSFDSLMALYGYTMQVYLDFSAYSDIAIGSALLFGFHLPDNFDRPYMAHSIQDFWRRWHQTLGSWLRDYLYYPLGGSKGSDMRTYYNLFVTFVLIGLWHGASWLFVVYGCAHATAMCVHRFVRVNVAKRQKPTLTWHSLIWKVFLTLNFVVFARILFRCKTWDQVGNFLTALGGGGAVEESVKTLGLFDRIGESWSTDLGRYADGTGAFGGYALALLAACFLVHWTPRRYVRVLGATYEAAPPWAQGLIFGTAIMLIAQIASGHSPFIYFQF